jgi:acetyl-CoA carboxylase alpha subunit
MLKMLMLPIRVSKSTETNRNKNILKNLTAWQRVQFKNPSRPYTLDHVRALCEILF